MRDAVKLGKARKRGSRIRLELRKVGARMAGWVE
jgi:hypothetical protein